MMGRPKKQPSANQLAEFNPARLLHDDIADILIKSKAQGRWTWADVQILIDWFLWPDGFDVIKTELTKRQEIKYTMPLVSFAKNATVTRDHKKIYRALHLAKLFSQSPDELIVALPKMHKKILSYFSNPLKKTLMDEAMRNAWMKSSWAQEQTKEFWTKPANVLAAKNSTPRTVENARAKIRKIIQS